MKFLYVVGSEQNVRKIKENNVALFGVPAFIVATYEERDKEDENIICEILEG